MTGKVTAQQMKHYLAGLGVETAVDFDTEKLYVTGVRMHYRTKVRIIEAFRWTGQPRSQWPAWATPGLLYENGSALTAYTASGPVRVAKGAWCILGENEINPCTDEDFRKCYELLPFADQLADETVRDSEELDDGA
jgi:hypothetical protein